MNKIGTLAIALGMAFVSQANNVDLLPIGDGENANIAEVNDIRSYEFSDFTRMKNLESYSNSENSNSTSININQFDRNFNEVKTVKKFTKLNTVNNALDCFYRCGGVITVDSETKYNEKIEKDKKDSKESEDGKGEEEKKDTAILGIGDVQLDTNTKTVMIDDTIIYEEFEVIIKDEDIVKDEHKEEPYYAEKGLTGITSRKDIARIIVDGTPVPNMIQDNEEPIEIIEDKELVEFNPVVFPNPATNSDLIQIKLESDADTHVEVFDMSGRQVKVLDNQLENIEIGHLKTGSYFIIIKDGNGHSTSKKLLVR